MSELGAPGGVPFGGMVPECHLDGNVEGPWAWRRARRVGNMATQQAGPTTGRGSGAVDLLSEWLLAIGLGLAVGAESWLRSFTGPERQAPDPRDRSHEVQEALEHANWHSVGPSATWAGLAAGATVLFLLLRRRHPGWACAGMGVTALVASTVAGAPVTSTVAFAVTLYSLAVTVGTLIALAVGGVAVLSMLAVAVLDDREGGVPLVSAAAAAVVAVPLLAAAATRNRRAYLVEVEARLDQARAEQQSAAARAVAEERVKLARDLHDVLAHSLTVVTMQVGVAQHLVRTHPDRAEHALDEARRAGAAALADLRGTLALLRGDAPEERAPTPGVSDLTSLAEGIRSTGVPVELDVSGVVDPVPDTVGLVAYRVVQEGLTNVTRHAAGAQRVSVVVSTGSGCLRVTVSDSGGSNSANGGVGTGTGLTGLGDRCRALGGTLDAGPSEGGGFSLDAVLPLEPPASDDLRSGGGTKA